ncbi:MAG TPA: MauE/DoxX family redox-associated membrane protein [Micromonosporaceae bacterium]
MVTTATGRWLVVQPWLSTVARLGLATVWLIAGASKIDDLAASGRSVVAYRIFPYDVATTIGAVLPFLEIGLGLLLLAGLATRFASFASIIMFMLFVAGIVSAWARGLRIDCGCFSAGGDLAANEQPQYFAETVRDIGLIVVAGFLALFPRSRASVDALLLDERHPA